ncbi:S8 family serine peptidase [Oxalobacteraceae bacterium]|nr:S8 family serine peptidase [Oxalobacteraceae bacterium]
MSSYIVLKRVSPSAGRGTAPGRGYEALGNGPGTENWGLAIESADKQQATEMAADPAVGLVARTMPTTLVAPVDLETSVPAAPAAAPSSWGIAAVGADQSGFTGKGVTVAVLDTGIDRAHPAFSGAQITEQDFSNSGNGDRKGHGSHCAGTIFGRDVNGQRIGIARGVENVLIGKVLGDDGQGESAMIFDALTWALRNKADIISMSLGFDFAGLVGRLNQKSWPLDLATSTALESYRANLRMFDAIMRILKANEDFGQSPLVVAAAGNESRRDVNPEFRIAASLPAAAESVVSVAAVDMEGRVASFSNSGALLAAPGVAITSAWPGGRMNTISGTSMACPHVAGLAALWWQQQREQGVLPTAQNVTARLLANLRRDGLKPAFNQLDFGQGMATAPR